jgi:hypothetical protein
LNLENKKVSIIVFVKDRYGNIIFKNHSVWFLSPKTTIRVNNMIEKPNLGSSPFEYSSF